MDPAAAQHLLRMQDHIRSANDLKRLGNEWSAVAYFYAVYRAGRAALISDSRLDDDATARSIHPRLSASSRHVEHHSGGMSRPPGMNEVVRLLYRPIAAKYLLLQKYLLLHQKSVEVRYGSGLLGLSADGVAGLAIEVVDYWETSGLISEPPAR